MTARSIGTRLAVLIAALSVGLAACSAPQDTAGNVTPAQPSIVLDTARAGGASGEQLNALRRAQEQGGAVPQSALAEAIALTFACFDAAGIPHTPLTWVDDANGFPQPDYGLGSAPGLGEDASLLIADRCIATHSDFLHRAYSSQPAANDKQPRTLRRCDRRSSNVSPTTDTSSTRTLQRTRFAPASRSCFSEKMVTDQSLREAVAARR